MSPVTLCLMICIYAFWTLAIKPSMRSTLQQNEKKYNTSLTQHFRIDQIFFPRIFFIFFLIIVFIRRVHIQKPHH